MSNKLNEHDDVECNVAASATALMAGALVIVAFTVVRDRLRMGRTRRLLKTEATKDRLRNPRFRRELDNLLYGK